VSLGAGDDNAERVDLGRDWGAFERTSRHSRGQSAEKLGGGGIRKGAVMPIFSPKEKVLEVFGEEIEEEIGETGGERQSQPMKQGEERKQRVRARGTPHTKLSS